MFNLAHNGSNPPLIGVIISGGLYRGDEMGYCLLITSDAIIGAKNPQHLADFEAYVGPGSNATDSTKTQATEIADKLAQTKEFSISAGSLDQIFLKEPGMFFGGYVILKMGLSSVKIGMRLLSVGGSQELHAYTILVDSLRALAGEGVRVSRIGLPLTFDWPWTKPYHFNKRGQLYGVLAQNLRTRRILTMLSKTQSGMSNAEIDAALSDYSQWTTLQPLRELLAAGLIEYKTDLFGNPGKYLITDLGTVALNVTVASADT